MLLNVNLSCRQCKRKFSCIKSLQDSGKFRRDLFFRLRTHHVHIPLLRERLDDLPLLLDYFLEDAREKLGGKSLRIPVSC